MLKVLRPDHVIIRELDGNIILQNNNFEGVKYPIKPIFAFILCLFNGQRSDDEIIEIVNHVFEERHHELSRIMKYFFLEYSRFLIPMRKAEKLFSRPWPEYESKQYLIKQVNNFMELKRLPAPKYLCLYLTNNCTRQCQYCYAEAKLGKSVEMESMSTDSIRKIVYEAFKLGVNKILLTGGEPFLRDDIYQIIDYAASLNISIELLTKHLIKEDKIKAIDFSLLKLALSIDSHIPEVSNVLAGSATFYEDIMKNINILNSIDLPYNIMIVITNSNKESILETIKYFIDKGANHIFTSHYLSIDTAYFNKELLIPDEEKQRIDEQLIDFQKNTIFSGKLTHEVYSAAVVDPTQTSCSTGYSRLSIRFDGRYIFCEKLANADDIELGNISDKSILDVWNSDELQKYLSPQKHLYNQTQCFYCSKFFNCKGKNSCIYKSKKQYGRYFHPIKEVEYVCSQR